jgi:ribosome-associated heat shock protein Hsp15
VDGAAAKPSREVTVGNRVEIAMHGMRRTVVVTALADRRGPASVAATLYEETPESAAERERLSAERRLARPVGADLSGRPTKRDRRLLDAMRRAQRRGR